jgi:hypothetical protein
VNSKHPTNKPRDLDAIKLSPVARGDIERLREIRVEMDALQSLFDSLAMERTKIWRVHYQRRDIRPSEPADLSGVTAPYVSRKASEKKPTPTLLRSTGT